MRVSPRRFRALVASVVVPCLLGVGSAPSSAAPINVTLRIEGSTKTLYEGSVATEPILSPPGISTKSSGGAHPCDVKDNGANEGFPPAAATPTAALYDAAAANGLAFDASWFGESGSLKLFDFLVSQVGSDVNGGAPEYPSWGYAVNFTTAGVGGCQFQLAPGSDVLWAYNYANLHHLLSLSGPATANAGSSFTVHVSDGQTGEAISGAAIGELVSGTTTALPSGPTSDSSGNAAIMMTRTGSVTLKATRTDSVRSNGLAVCVHAGNDGSCGTTAPGGGSSTTSLVGVQHFSSSVPPAAETAEVIGPRNGHTYSRRVAPRVLRGRVVLSGGATLRQVRIRLERRYRGHCFNFSGSRERFIRARRCSGGSFFSVGGAESFSYLLPAPLPSGRYIFDIEAVDAAGHVTKLLAGVSHVNFRVT